MSEKSLVHLYVGDGKGKTTSAMGLAIRNYGSGGSVKIFQFLKGKHSSELTTMEKLGIPVVQTKTVLKFTFQMNDEEKAQCRQNCIDCLDMVAADLTSGNYSLIVMDEVVDAVNAKMITKEELIKAVTNRSENTEVVMTGRNPDQEIQDICDYITLMTAEKHPYTQGVPARKGIEF